MTYSFPNISALCAATGSSVSALPYRDGFGRKLRTANGYVLTGRHAG
jgi:hypothetical protein